MGTMTISTRRGDTDFEVVGYNPGAPVGLDYEFTIRLGLGARVDEVFLAIRRLENWLQSNRSFWEGLQ